MHKLYSTKAGGGRRELKLGALHKRGAAYERHDERGTRGIRRAEGHSEWNYNRAYTRPAKFGDAFSSITCHSKPVQRFRNIVHEQRGRTKRLVARCIRQYNICENWPVRGWYDIVIYGRYPELKYKDRLFCVCLIPGGAA